MGYFRFHQNNSGGGFDKNDDAGLGPLVWIQADTPEEANAYAEQIGIYFNGVKQGWDCSCCGDRWDKVDKYDMYTRVRLNPEYDFDWHPIVYVHHKSGDGFFIERVKK